MDNELDVKRLYLILRKHGRNKQAVLRKQISFKLGNNPLYSEFEHGLALGYTQAYINVLGWFKQCQKEKK